MLIKKPYFYIPLNKIIKLEKKEIYKTWGRPVLTVWVAVCISMSGGEMNFRNNCLETITGEENYALAA